MNSVSTATKSDRASRSQSFSRDSVSVISEWIRIGGPHNDGTSLDKPPIETRSARTAFSATAELRTRSPMHAYRTHSCGELRQSQVGERVNLSGGGHRKRDHGNLLFVDLRDHHGITQIVSDVADAAFKALEAVRVESVITVEGEVVRRDAEAVNPNLPTGQIEIHAEAVEVQSAAHEL